MKWAESTEASDAFLELDALIKGDPALLALRVNYLTQVITIVSEPEAQPRPETSAAIAAAVAKVEGATSEIVQGCATKTDLDAAATSAREAMTRVITSEDFKRDGGVGISANYATGRVEIRSSADAADRIREAMEVGAALADHAGGSINSTSRLVDPPPHFGGAWYTTWDTGTQVGACTTGFGARFTFVNMDVMATAAHCGVGGPVPMGGYNAGHLVGLFAPAASYANYTYPQGPAYFGLDVAMMYNTGTTYSNGFYTDPGFSPRYANTYGDAVAGQTVCMNGAVTGATCGAIPVNYNASYCDWQEVWQADKCVWGVQFYRFVGGLAQPGDSGGTVYQQGSGSAGKINGVISGGDITANNIIVSPTSFFQANAIVPKT